MTSRATAASGWLLAAGIARRAGAGGDRPGGGRLRAARAIRSVAARSGVEMPLCEMAYRVLFEGLPAKEAVRALMSRPIRSEAG